MKRGILCFFILCHFLSFADEGMHPLSKIKQLPLKEAGLKIPVDDIYKEDGTGLVNALVRIDGCTGSFISDEGLIITNHHCVYGTVASLSSVENNYLKNGFYASTNEKELKTNKKCRITLAFEDVSEQVLAGISSSTSPEVRSQLIKSNRSVILEGLPQKEGIKYEISEMLAGTEYTLFTYKMLTDVRLVYVPPKSVGKFGGETDNWVWPRHNADFSIVRAYDNGKPYQPKAHFKVNASGSKPNDFAFILGYPGRTYRNMPAQFLTYQQEYILPIIADYFEFQINQLEKLAANDEKLSLKFASRIARLSNTSKNFRGKLQGLRRTNIIKNRKDIQDYLRKIVKEDPQFKQFSNLFDELDRIYASLFLDMKPYLYSSQLFSSSGVFSGMASVVQVKEQVKEERLSGAELDSFLSKNKKGIRARLKKGANIYHIEADKAFLAQALYKIYVLKPEQQELPILNKIAMDESSAKQNIRAYVDKVYSKTKFTNTTWLKNMWEENPKKFIKLKDPAFKLVKEIQDFYYDEIKRRSALSKELNALLPQLFDLKKKAMKDQFIPDANGTLRITYGHTRGYEPQDGVVHEPYTTLTGIYEKAAITDNKDYFMESELLEKMKKAEPADVLKHPFNGQVVTALLYDMDTTGGNSGSPIINANGELIGVNFDRAFTATINDYAYSESYSRAIGVDIRYVLFVMKYVHQADEVLAELGVDLD